ncbi:MAG: MarR family transcriptional regulator [Bacteroidota bacterium]
MQTIEEIISQKKFKDEYQKGLISLMYLVNQIKDLQATIFKPYNITLQQYNVLRILRGQFPNPINIAVIKERMLYKNSDVSRIIARLIKTELISTIKSKSDKRALDIVISNKGFKLLNQVDLVIGEVEIPFKVLDSDEIKALNHSLIKIINNLGIKK